MADAIRVLYVDDEPYLLDIGKIFLEETGEFLITTIDSAPAALGILEKQSFDVIISDYQMTEMDVIQFLIEVRTRYGQVPFILFTGRGREEVVIQAINNGADFYLEKGGEPDSQFAELSHKIKHAVYRKRGEVELAVSQILLKETFQQSPVPMVLVSMPDEIIRIINPACREFLGFKDETSVIGTKFLDLKPSYKDFDSDGKERSIEDSPLARALLGQKTTNLEGKIVRKDGTIRWELVSGTPIYNAKGEIIAGYLILTDITGRKQAEDALKHQSRALAILNSVITTANKAIDFSQLLKIILEESLRLLDFDAGGIYLVDFSKRVANVVHSINLPPEFLEEIQPLPIDKKPYDLLFVKNESIISDNYAQISPDRSRKYGFQSMASIPLISKGTTIGAMNIASIRRYSISEEEKQTLLSIGTELGSTIERMAAEEEVNLTSKNFETLFNSINEMVFVMDMEGNILAINNSVKNSLSYTSEELKGTNILLLHLPEHRKDALHIIQGMISGTIDLCPLPVIAKDGTQIEVETKVTRGRWNNKEVLIGVTRDISERKRVEKDLKERIKELNCLYGVSALLQLPDISIEEILKRTILLLQSTWLFSEITEVCIILNQTAFKTPGFRETPWIISQKIIVNGNSVGEVRVCYLEERPDVVEGPFLAEERMLLNTIADQLSHIIEQKWTQESLKESNIKLQLALFGSDTGMWEIDIPSMKGSIDIRAAQILGYQEEDIGSDITDWNNLSHPEDVPLIQKQLVLCLEKRVSFFESEHRMRHASGEWIWVNGKGKITHRDLDGSPLRITGTLQNITSRKLAEKALQESENRFRKILEKAPLPLCYLDRNEVITFRNERFIQVFGYTEDDVLTLTEWWLHAYPDSQYRQWVTSTWNGAVIRAIDEGGDITPVEYNLTCKNGETRIVEISGITLDDGLLATFIDLTDRKRAEEAIYKANKKLTLLSSITRHDINNQLTILQGYLNILENEHSDSSFREFLQKVIIAAQRISAMIRFTKEYEAIGVNVPTWQDLRTLIDTAAKQSPPGLVNLKNSFPVGTEVFADPLIFKVFYNLIDNAVRYGEKITNIQFSLITGDGSLKIVCEDGGVGIPYEEKKKIFERGFGKNTGLGLFLSREILDITGIEISETGEPGLGARFEIIVPNGKWRIKREIN